MAEYIELSKPNKIILNPKQRTHLIILTYLLNFILYVILFDIYNNIILKWGTLFLIISFATQMLARQTNIGSINGWTIVYAFINGFAFGINSMLFSYNLLVIGINLLYFKYILKQVDLKEEKTKPYK